MTGDYRGVKVHVEARVRVFSAEEGGRRTPVTLGYRPGFHLLDDEKSDYSMDLSSLDPDPLHPGQIGRIGLRFIESWELLAPRLAVGMAFQLREGFRVTAEGVIEWLAERPHP